MKFLDWLRGIFGAKKEIPVLTPLAPIIKKKLELKKRKKKANTAVTNSTSTVTTNGDIGVVLLETPGEIKEMDDTSNEKPKKEKKPRKPRKPKVEKPKEDVTALWASVGTPEVVLDPVEAVWVSQDKPVETPNVPEVNPETDVVKDVVKKTRKRKKKEG